MINRLSFVLLVVLALGVSVCLGIAMPAQSSRRTGMGADGSPVHAAPESLGEHERLRHERVFAKSSASLNAQGGSVPLSYLTPPHVSTGMPELTHDDFAYFLEQAQTMAQQQRSTLKSMWDTASLPSFAESRASIGQYLKAAADTAQHMQAGAQARAHMHEEEEKKPAWKYTDIKNPPDWLKYDQTQGGLPSTKPPAVPRMIAPPPPRAFPQFSYARPTGGPYSPPPVPSYSISSPPPVAAATWLPLAAYIQPPSDQPNPTA